MAQETVTAIGEQGSGDVVAESGRDGMRLTIYDGEVAAVARPTPEGALALGQALIAYAIAQGARP